METYSKAGLNKQGNQQSKETKMLKPTVRDGNVAQSASQPIHTPGALHKKAVWHFSTGTDATGFTLNTTRLNNLLLLAEIKMVRK